MVLPYFKMQLVETTTSDVLRCLTEELYFNILMTKAECSWKKVVCRGTVSLLLFYRGSYSKHVFEACQSK